MKGILEFIEEVLGEIKDSWLSLKLSTRIAILIGLIIGIFCGGYIVSTILASTGCVAIVGIEGLTQLGGPFIGATTIIWLLSSLAIYGTVRVGSIFTGLKSIPEVVVGEEYAYERKELRNGILFFLAFIAMLALTGLLLYGASWAIGYLIWLIAC